MMGAGKSSIGRRAALRLGIPFVDADLEIEKAAGMSISDIFATRGEAEFRAGEARVLLRLLDSGPQVLATGGGAFMDARTRALIHERATSIWLHAELDELVRRTAEAFEFHTMFTALHNFCAVDLSAFYFDIRKDSLYCDAPDAPRRRAVRSVLDRT
jgi:shikimate kinase